MRGRLICIPIMGFALYACLAGAQSESKVDVHLRFESPRHGTKRELPPAVAWLVPLSPTPESPLLPGQRYTLLQKNREFKPHLLVIPVGSVVDFPNKDPFFHNVFSLFDGKRFDLGLYEAGSTKSVTFSREGVSYIFCNIHPEMSAVVLTLSTSLYSVADFGGGFHISRVPQGEYDMHVWIEGVPQPLLNRMVRRVRVAPDSIDLGVIEAPAVLLKSTPHTNMYGQPYDRNAVLSINRGTEPQ